MGMYSGMNDLNYRKSENYFRSDRPEKTETFRFKRVQNKRYSGGNVAVAKLLQSCPTLCDPVDGSPPGSPVPGSLQARTLEWVAISFSNA